MARGTSLLALGFALLTWLGSARAEAPLRVLVLDQGNPALARKIRAEGRYAGFALLDAAALGGEAPDAAGLARTGAAAAIEISAHEQVRLYLTSSEGAYSQVSLEQRAGDAESFPLRVIEQLRARLVDLGWALASESAPKESAATSQADIVRAAPSPPASGRMSVNDAAAGAPSSAPRAWRFWLQGGLSVLDAAGGVGVMAQGVLGAQLEWDAGWGLGALALLPLSDNEVRKSQGEADVRLYLYLLRASYSRPLAGAWRWTAAAGPGLALLPLTADAQAPWIGKTDRLLCGVAHLELGIARQLGGWLRTSASLLAGLSAPRPVVSFGGEEAAAWGHWFGALSLRAEVALPPTEEISR